MTSQQFDSGLGHGDRPAPRLAFGPFELDPETGVLREGERLIPLDAKPFDLLLYLARREVVVIVEANLTKTARQRLRGHHGVDDFCGVPRIGRELAGRVRMHPDGKPYRIPLRRDLLALLDFRFIVCREDDERVCQLRVPGALDDGGEVFDELGSGDVAV